jgi:hypothetical protein
MHLPFTDQDLVVVGLEFAGDLAAHTELIQVGVVAESDCEGLYRAIHEPAHRRDVRARVDAAAQKDAERRRTSSTASSTAWRGASDSWTQKSSCAADERPASSR